MKKIIFVFFVFVVILYLCGCFPFHIGPGSIKQLQSDLGFEIKEKDITEQNELFNSYGSFGDGLLYHQISIELDLSEQSWNQQPLSTDVADFLESKSSRIFFQTPQNFYWKFINRTSPSTPYIANASLLIYDVDTKILHWIRYDS